MVDNVAITAGTGTTIAADDVGGALHQRVKVTWGPDGTGNDADTATGKPLPVQLRGSDGTDRSNSLPVVATNAGTFAVQESGAALTALQLIDDTVFAEDAASANADKGIQVLTRRTDTATATSGTDGDYQPFITDANGRLHVNVGNTVTISSPAVTNAGTFAVQESGSALTALQLIDDVVFAEDVAAQAGDKGVHILSRRSDTAAATAGTDGDYQSLVSDSAGKLHVNVGNTVTVGAHALTAGETHIGEVGGKTVVKTITMTATTTILASADIIADTQQMDAALRVTDGTGVIQSMTVFDPDDNAAFAFDVYIHNTSTSMGTENSGISISDANAAAGILGVVSFATTDAKDLINGRMYHKANLGIPVTAVSGTDDLYFSIVNGSGTPTFAGGSIPIRVGILQD